MSERIGLASVLRALVFAACLCLGGGGVLALRSVWSGESALRRAEAAFDRGDLRQSVVFARRAAEFYLPGAPHVDRAYARLQVIGQGAEASGDVELAGFAWSAMRQAALESAAPSIGRPELELANQHLARLAARSESSPASAAQTEQRVLRALRQRNDSGPLGALLLGGGLLLVAVGLTWLGLRGLDRDGRLQLRHWLVGCVLCLLGAACWTFAAYRT
jgi:hypothetical protein